mmetsp:Transcript_19535/g.40492  ORF Transcript_19535/g.40492 Transcript_19535/m.40492 type:complete len:224 (-) Transcript_19535:451-1122(-)
MSASWGASLAFEAREMARVTSSSIIDTALSFMNASEKAGEDVSDLPPSPWSSAAGAAAFFLRGTRRTGPGLFFFWMVCLDSITLASDSDPVGEKVFLPCFFEDMGGSMWSPGGEEAALRGSSCVVLSAPSSTLSSSPLSDCAALMTSLSCSTTSSATPLSSSSSPTSILDIGSSRRRRVGSSMIRLVIKAYFGLAKVCERAVDPAIAVARTVEMSSPPPPPSS